MGVSTSLMGVSTSPVTSVDGCVYFFQDYIASKLHQENDAIAKDEKQIAQFQEETAKMKGHLEELRSKARVFQVMRCESCKSGLRLPAVHFLCQHSYHLK